MNVRLDLLGYPLEVTSATLTSEPALTFNVRVEAPVNSLMFYSNDPRVSGASSAPVSADGIATTSLSLAGLPDHPINIYLMRIYATAQGPWTITWRPEANPKGLPAAATPDLLSTIQALQPTLTSTPTFTSSDPLYLEVTGLTDRFSAYLHSGPAWIHIRT